MEQELVYRTVRYNSPEEQVAFLENRLNEIENNSLLSDIQKDEIKKFASSCLAQELSPKRVDKYARVLEMFALILKKPFKDADRADLENLWKEILLKRKDGTDERYSPETLRDFKIALKKYYKIAEGNGEIYPEKVRFLKCTKTKGSQQDTLPQLLKADDIGKLLDATDNIMWKAYISVAWETGMRVGELISLRIRDVTIGDSGIRIRCRGKTGTREFPLLVECYNGLANWLNHHPYREDIDSLVFINTSNNYRHRSLNPGSIITMLRRIAKKACVKVPKLNQQLIRKSRATHLAGILPEHLLKKYMGWKTSSTVSDYYVFLNNSHLENALRKMHGLQPETKPENKIKKCTRCLRITSGGRFCETCAMPLTMEAAMEQKEKLDNLDAIMPLINRMRELQPILERLEKEKGNLV